MKKIFYPIILAIIVISISGCAGYQPIYTTSKIDIKIIDYSILGEKKLGKQIYSQLFDLSKTATNTESTKNVNISINVQENKNPTSRDQGGKILGYKINLITDIIFTDFTSGDEIINQSISLSSTYTVQDQFAETKKIENQSRENLLNRTYEEILNRLSDSTL